ncbi:hypothetical protein WH52_08500 [Tenacibaculum holothuriorum]|uniref:HTH araC/xylS-type domain-containing protein n=1 Tax=Tenacibaculum holothuriorum TaxID=1635173 RepID=A0A1Y2PEG0_9FLAO|nr:hypothetical protein WH52_08500 [Tenacibaculum holothuriorum]
MAFLLVPLGTIIPYALGVLLFYYIKSIYNEKVHTKNILKSLIPFFIGFVLYSLPKYFLFTNSNEISSIQLVSFIIPFIGYIHFIYYLYKCFLILKMYRKQLTNQYSNIQNIDLKWFYIWVYGIIAFVFIDILSGILLLLYPSIQFVLSINLLFLTILIWYVGYYGLNQTHVFLLNTEAIQEKKEIKNKPVLELNRSEEFHQKLEELFQLKQIYQQQNLSLREVAELLNTTDKKLSNYINTNLNTTFYEFVNTYRIRHFKEVISNGNSEKLTLLAIAFDSGFNSKATFNRVFKQQEGITPLQFKKSIEKSLIASSESI